MIGDDRSSKKNDDNGKGGPCPFQKLSQKTKKTRLILVLDILKLFHKL